MYFQAMPLSFLSCRSVPTHVVLVAALAVLGTVVASCGEPREGEPGRVDDVGPERRLRDAIDQTGLVSARVELRVRVAVDGVDEAEVASVGSIDRGGAAFDLDIVGPASFGLAADDDRPVGVRLVDGRFFQRGPVVDDLFPGVDGRWVEMGDTRGPSEPFGFVGPAGFAALDLLDDLADVREASPHRYQGALGEVRLDGLRVESVGESTFAAVVRNGIIVDLVVTIASRTGVVLTVELSLTDLGPQPIDIPATTELGVP